MRKIAVFIAVFFLVLGATAVLAQKGGSKKPPSGESGSNNLSFPVIWSDNLRPADWVPIAPWVFADLYGADYGTDPETGEPIPFDPEIHCVGEDDIVPGTAVPDDFLCYYGRANGGFDEETGDRIWLTDEPAIWWLQERAANKWQVFNVRPEDAGSGEFVVTAVDWGDLLESSGTLSQKQVRTEMTLLFNATGTAFADYIGTIAPDENGIDQVTCASGGDNPTDCLAALNMSGAVPGTDQSINEIQGTDFPEAGTILDPTTVKAGYHATVYSRCARLVIQKIPNPSSNEPTTFDCATARWNNAENPVVDLKAWDDTYSAEINAGGSMIYGYNWGVKKTGATSGTYRLSYVLDGVNCSNDSLNTSFTADTIIANPGNVNFAQLLIGGDPEFGASCYDETLTFLGGGLTYVDIELKVTGGGGGGR